MRNRFTTMLLLATVLALSANAQQNTRWVGEGGIEVLWREFFLEIRFAPNDVDTVTGHVLGGIFVDSLAKDSLFFSTGVGDVFCDGSYNFVRRDMHLRQCQVSGGNFVTSRRWIFCDGNDFRSCCEPFAEEFRKRYEEQRRMEPPRPKKVRPNIGRWVGENGIEVLWKGFFLEIRFAPNDVDTVVGFLLRDIFVDSLAKDSLFFSADDDEVECKGSYNFVRRDMHLEQCQFWQGNVFTSRRWILCDGGDIRNYVESCYEPFAEEFRKMREEQKRIEPSRSE